MRTMMIPSVDYHPHANERSSWWETRKRMRRIGFAPWHGFPTIDDPKRDDETFAQQRERLSAILELPDDDEEFLPGIGRRRDDR